jgi:tetrahydromethanopterin S-methyltransferase subunit A
LPFAEEEVERMYMENVKNEEEEKIKRKQFSMFQSSDYEDDFKVRFRKNKKPDELKKGLLEEFQEVLDLKEEKKDQEEENDKAKTASSRIVFFYILNISCSSLF